MRQVQNLYSSLIAKLKIPDWDSKDSFNLTTSTLQSIPKKKYHFQSMYFQIQNMKRLTLKGKLIALVLSFIKCLFHFSY